MKLVVDENITFAMQAFSVFGEVQLISGRKINNAILKDADILIVRSITRVDEKLLHDTRVRFVGTATIGTDHIDLDFLEKNKIAFSDAKGCNADSVAEYFLSALLKIAVVKNIKLTGKTVGVVGVGNVGSRVAMFSKAIGLNVLKNDPPRERAGDGNDYVSLKEALGSEIISLHVPLNLSGVDQTYHMLNSKRINSLKRGAILINTSRGPVIDNAALADRLENKSLTVCLDVWEGEPKINTALLEKVYIASPHIAGYSFEGKVNGTKLIYNSLCNFLKTEINQPIILPEVKDNIIIMNSEGTIENKLYSVIKHIYNIDFDDSSIRKMAGMNENDSVLYFDKLRKEYPLRREFNNYSVIIKKKDCKLGEMLKAFRFNVKTED